LFERISPDQFSQEDKTWNISGFNVGRQFQQYQPFIVSHIQSKSLLIESNTQAIMALFF
jgi:hypothetical protein